MLAINILDTATLATLRRIHTQAREKEHELRIASIQFLCKYGVCDAARRMGFSACYVSRLRNGLMPVTDEVVGRLGRLEE